MRSAQCIKNKVFKIIFSENFLKILYIYIIIKINFFVKIKNEQ